MTQIVRNHRRTTEQQRSGTNSDILPGGAACGAKLPRRPVAPSQHAAALPDLTFESEGQAGWPMAEADRPVALVIEDDPDARALITEILRRAGWSVRHARSGEVGLALAREHVPEVIVLDLALPKMSGLDVLRELKSAGWADQPTHVLVVSYFAMRLALPDLRLADGVVQKPFEATDLLAQLARARARALSMLA